MGMWGLGPVVYLATCAASVTALSIADAGAAGGDAAVFVAGTSPDRRPEGAPKITTYEKDAQWLATARAGVSDPLPPSLGFLNDQGGWFTPFTRPGMTGPYDIRGWHAAKGNGAAQEAPAK